MALFSTLKRSCVLVIVDAVKLATLAIVDSPPLLVVDEIPAVGDVLDAVFLLWC